MKPAWLLVAALLLACGGNVTGSPDVDGSAGAGGDSPECTQLKVAADKPTAQRCEP